MVGGVITHILELGHVEARPARRRPLDIPPFQRRLEHVADGRPREVRVRELRELRVHAAPLLFRLLLLLAFFPSRSSLQRPVLEVGLGQLAL